MAADYILSMLSLACGMIGASLLVQGSELGWLFLAATVLLILCISSETFRRFLLMIATFLKDLLSEGQFDNWYTIFDKKR